MRVAPWASTYPKDRRTGNEPVETWSLRKGKCLEHGNEYSAHIDECQQKQKEIADAISKG